VKRLKSGVMTVRLGHVAQTALGKMLQSRPLRGDDVEVAYLRAGLLGTTPESPGDLPTMFASPGEIDAYTVRCGDLLVAEGGDVGRAEFAPPVPTPTIIQNSLHRVRTETGDIRFLRYSLLALKASGWLDVLVNRSTFGHLTVEKLRSLRVAWPPIDDQRAVADFLDEKTSKIDSLMAKNRRMIELLQQRAARREAVAAWGEDRDDRVPCAPIGPIGALPRTWSRLRNKVFASEATDRSKDGSEELLSVSHLTGVTSRAEKNVTMFMAESLDGYKLVQPGDLVINTMWAWMGAAGVSRQPGIVSPAYGVYRFDQSIMLPAYYDILVRTPAYVTEMTRFSRGVWTSRLRLYPDEFLRLSAPVPPLEEQSEIVKRVSEANVLAHRSITKLERAVDLLNERRQALITAAVTGELDVAHAIAEEAS